MFFICFHSLFAIASKLIYAYQEAIIRLVTQRIIKKNLSTYLQKVRPNETVEVCESLKNGHCYAFSVCHGVMRAVGKLDWWEKALMMLTQSDNEDDNKILNLPDADVPITFSNLCERVVHYISFLQDTNLIPLQRIPTATELRLRIFPPYQLRQSDFLNPEQPFFEMLDNQNKCHTIAIRCKFTRLDEELPEMFLKLFALLKGEQKIICLIKSAKHALELSVVHDKWMLYDPNYDHSFSHTIHKTFAKESVKALQKEIFAQLKRVDATVSNYLTFEIALLTGLNAKKILQCIDLEYFKHLTPDLIRKLNSRSSIHFFGLRNQVMASQTQCNRQGPGYINR